MFSTGREHRTSIAIKLEMPAYEGKTLKKEVSQEGSDEKAIVHFRLRVFDVENLSGERS
jgi:hypothetical protein